MIAYHRTALAQQLVQAVQVMATYHRHGIAAARKARAALPEADKRLLLMHALVAAMQGNLREAWELQRLARI